MGKTTVPSTQNRLEVAGDTQDEDVTEEDFETTEGETVDLYDKLMEISGRHVTDNDLT